MLDKKTMERVLEAAEQLHASDSTYDLVVRAALLTWVDAHTMSDDEWTNKMKCMQGEKQ